MFKIEKGIPAPDHRTRAGKYPWRDMKVGDSVFINGEDGAGGSASSAARAALLWGQRHDANFRTSTVEGGVRIWRVE